MDRAGWIGQLFVIGFPGTAVSAELREHIEYVKPGGYVFFKRNLGEPHAIRALNDALIALSPELPPFLAVDQEGGAVARLRHPFTEFPGNRALAAAYEREGLQAVEAQAAVFAEELRIAGFNWDFAPVLDVDSNPRNPVIGPRSFSSDPERVAMLGVAFARALEAGGILSCGKHAPGHGNTALDSHVDLPIEETPKTVLRMREYIPFQAYAQAKLAALMTAHVVYRTLDKERPGTLSEHVITGVIRNQIGFEGVVVTDDLEMKAIDARYGPEESALLAVLAGCDVLLICHTPEKQRRAFAALVEEDRKSRVLRERIEASLGRVLRLKKRLSPPLPYRPERIGSASALALTMHLRTLTEATQRGDPTETAIEPKAS